MDSDLGRFFRFPARLIRRPGFARRAFRGNLIRGALVALLGLHGLAGEIYSFAGAGPYTHIGITTDALDRFSHEIGWDVALSCSEILLQTSVVSDTAENMEQFTFHCDNNDLAGCSYRLDQFKGEANSAYSQLESLKKMGMALHIVQDFYAHSNWAETFGFSMFPAPIRVFKDIRPPVDVQSGNFPDIFPDVGAQLACFLVPEDQWNRYIYGATHACMNKDSNLTFRGARAVPGGFGVTYHELAGMYAVNHSVQLLKYFARTNPWFKACARPRLFTGGCNKRFLDWVH
jgi:hypothetical protein